MTRKRFSERQVLETLLQQGSEIKCYRCKVPFLLVAHSDLGLANDLWNRHFIGYAEREHITELALGGKDAPENCRYSCRASHKEITNGTKATTAGSSKQRIAKVKRLQSGGRKRKGPPMKSRPFQKKPEGYEYKWGRPKA